MKKSFIILLLLPFLAQAQVTYNNANQNTFYGIGGYSFTQTTFPNGVQTNPYIISGPSPQNSFTYSVSANGGIKNISSYISTNTINTPITIIFKGNNVRKFACQAIGYNAAGDNATFDIINVTVITNLNNTATLTGNFTNPFVGFSITGENEYIVSVTATFASNNSNVITLHDIMVGDNTPQNVALSFDGVNDYVSLPNTVGNFSTNDNFTVTCWIRPSATQASGTEHNIINKWIGSGGYAFTIKYFSTSGIIQVGQYDGTNFPNIVSSNDLRDGKWHHIAFVKNGNTLSLYIDATLIGSTTDTATGSTTNNTPLNFGREATGTKYFKGEIDEVRIWNISKTLTQIGNERFCKNPITTNLVAAYNFNHGVPNGTNTLITQINDAVSSTNNGTLTNFSKTGDVSNFVTGLVKYVKRFAKSGFPDGSSWPRGFDYLQEALVPEACNDLVEVYVCRGSYDPTPPSQFGNPTNTLSIPAGMKIYGGFFGTEKNINERNLTLVNNTQVSILTGDLSNDDISSDFVTNRSDNSKTVLKFLGDNILLDGFKISGGNGGDNVGNSAPGAIVLNSFNNLKIQNCIFTDNQGNYSAVFQFRGTNISLINNKFIANKNSFSDLQGTISLWSLADVTSREHKIENCLFTGNSTGIYLYSFGSSSVALNVNIKNCTLAGNGRAIDYEQKNPGNVNCIIINSIIYGNGTGVTNIGDGVAPNIFLYSLIQGSSNTSNGNINGNPQFINPVNYTAPTMAGDYHVKWCSIVIDAGTNYSLIPVLDLDRNSRNFNGDADMGVYEFLGNKSAVGGTSNITGTIDMPVYVGSTNQIITSDAKITPPAGAIDFKAPNAIILNPGFEARGMSSYFKAQIGANVSCGN